MMEYNSSIAIVPLDSSNLSLTEAGVRGPCPSASRLVAWRAYFRRVTAWFFELLREQHTGSVADERSHHLENSSARAQY